MTTPGMADGFGTARRVQALYRWGWPFEVQARHAGLPIDFMVALTEPAPTPRHIAAAIVRIYDELAMEVPPPGPVTDDARADGARRGWWLPLEWDDDEIDDPAAIPATIAPFTVEANKAWLENYAALVRQGLGRQQIADLLGTTSSAITDRLIRARAGGYLPAGIQMRAARRIEAVIPCGSRAAYMRHQRRGEAIDPACRAANNAYAHTVDVKRRAQAKVRAA